MGQYLKIMVFADRVEIPSGRVGWNPLRESWMERGIQRQGRWNPLRESWMERKSSGRGVKIQKKAGPAL